MEFPPQTTKIHFLLLSKYARNKFSQLLKVYFEINYFVMTEIWH